MNYLLILFWLPNTILQWVSLMLPFNPKWYRPATETERGMSEFLRNKVRLTNYHIKRNHK